MKQISNKFQQGTLTILIARNAFKLEKVGPAFSLFNPFPSLPPVATDDREQFQFLNIVLNDKTSHQLNSKHFLEFNWCEDRF